MIYLLIIIVLFVIASLEVEYSPRFDITHGGHLIVWYYKSKVNGIKLEKNRTYKVLIENFIK